MAELAAAGVPDALARRVAIFAALKAAPDIVLVADRAGKAVGDVAATYFATEAFFQLDRVAGAVPNIVVADYFDRLALDRALDSIGDAERRPPPPWSATAKETDLPAPTRWRNGCARAKRKSSASARPSTRSPARAHAVEALVAASLLGDLARN